MHVPISIFLSNEYFTVNDKNFTYRFKNKIKERITIQITVH